MNPITELRPSPDHLLDPGGLVTPAREAPIWGAGALEVLGTSRIRGYKQSHSGFVGFAEYASVREGSL
jgi:hypothetical protein